MCVSARTWPHPSSGGLLSPEYGPGCAGAGELREARSDELSTATLRINQGSHWFCQAQRLDRPLAVVLVPDLKPCDGQDRFWPRRGSASSSGNEGSPSLRSGTPLCTRLHSESAAIPLMPLRTHFAIFSECALILLRNWSDFDSAILSVRR
jgi:hypothetical protein